jgi:NAD+ kinase
VAASIVEWAASHGARMIARPDDAARCGVEASDGGPVVSPLLDAVIIAPLAPMSETIEVRLQPAAGLVVRLDRDRHQRRNQVKLSLLDLPFLPDELRDLR